MKKITFLIVALLYLSATGLLAQSSILLPNYYLNTFDSDQALTGTTISDDNSVISVQDGAQLLESNGTLSVWKNEGFTVSAGRLMMVVTFNQPLDLRESAKLTLVMRGEQIQAGGVNCQLVLVIYAVDANGKRGSNSWGGIMANVTSSDWSTYEFSLTDYASEVDFSQIKQLNFKLETRFSGVGNSVTGTVMFDRLSVGVEPDGLNTNCTPISVSPELAVVRFDSKITLTTEQLTLKEKTSGAVVPIRQLHARYKNKEYSIYADFEPGKQYTLVIDNENYIGEPVTLHTDLHTNPVYPSVDWANSTGKQLTADLWGVNDMNVAPRAQNQDMADFYKDVKPVIRLHSASRLNTWVDQANKCWNRDRIKADLDNAMYAYRYGDKVMLNMDHIPTFIGTQFNLTVAQEDEIAAFFGQLPGIIKDCGYHIEMYEFFNENWHVDHNSTSLLPAYWRLLNKIARAVKAADKTIKVGGSAEAWSWSQSVQGFVDNCATDMDFFSFHQYMSYTFSSDGLLYNPDYGNWATGPVNYIRQKGLSLPVYMDEFNIDDPNSSGPEQLRDHNGASWIACFIKDVALKGMTGLNYWNTEDGNMGLNYNTAVALLYRKSGKYLRGDIARHSVGNTRLEIIPIVTGYRKSVLLVNRKDEKTTVMNAKNLIDGDASKIIGWRLDETTVVEVNDRVVSAIRSNSPAYIWDPLYVVPTDIVLNPHGMVLLTNDETDATLSAIEVSAGTLTPAFDYATTNYTVDVGIDVTSISVTGTANPYSANASVSGNVTNMPLKTGDNVVEIVVRAEDGTSTTYTVTVIRSDRVYETEATIASITANGDRINVDGETIEYIASCGETSVELSVQPSSQSLYSTITVDDAEYVPNQSIALTGDITVVNIRVRAETGGAESNYTFKISAPLNANSLYYKRWNDVVAINRNPATNGRYNVSDIRWYNPDGTSAGNGDYIAASGNESIDDYQVEIKTVETQAWHRVCAMEETKAEEKAIACPNPVPRGEKLSLQLPESFTGGVLNIYGITGALVKSGLPLPTTSNSIDVSEHVPGIYLLQITDKKGNFQVIKIIIE
jgi:hypothetical protein